MTIEILNMKTKFYCIVILMTSVAFCNKTNAQANTSLSNLSKPTKINVDLLPDKDSKHSLGNSTKAWMFLYLDSAIYIDSARFIAFKTGTGSYNTAIGKDVLHFDQSGSSNTGVGYRSLYNNTDGYNNTACGGGALYSDTSGYDNSAFGRHALYSNTTGYYNTAVGTGALYSNDIGVGNTAVGYQALEQNSTYSANFNTAVGFQALYSNTSIGGFNTATGWEALYYNTIGQHNTADGNSALSENTTGDANTAIGYQALGVNKTGSLNTGIGYGADVIGNNYSNAMVLGYDALVNASNKVQVGNSHVTVIGGQVGWSTPSDGRFKNNIKENVPGLAFINKLKPVTYTLELKKFDKFLGKKDGIINSKESQENYVMGEKKIHTGFVAQDVEKAAQEIHYDFDGVNHPQNEKDNYSLVYADFVPSLVKAVQELNDSLEKSNASLQQQINELKTTLQLLADKTGVSLSAENISISNASLAQNIPNPFNHSTTIGYSIAKQFSSANIIITDKNGNVLKQVDLSANKGSVNVDASTLSSGAYQYSLIVDDKLIDTKQMVLSK
jgi:hypothetical protein